MDLYASDRAGGPERRRCIAHVRLSDCVLRLDAGGALAHGREAAHSEVHSVHEEVYVGAVALIPLLYTTAVRDRRRKKSEEKSVSVEGCLRDEKEKKRMYLLLLVA